MRRILACVLSLVFVVDAKTSVHTVQIAPGVNMPLVSLGTGSGQHGDVANATALWVQAGGVGIDTAYDYSDQTEIAKGLADCKRDIKDMFITTKIPCATYKQAQSYIKTNLQQLHTDSVDLMLIHFPYCHGTESVKETWRALEDARSAGQTRTIGVSHFTTELLQQLNSPPAINQCSLSVGYHDDDTIAYCAAHNITYMAYSPLCGGANGSSCTHGNVMQIPEVMSIASKHKVSPAQVALKWIVQQHLPVTTAVWQEDYMLEDLDLWTWGDLSDDEMDTLRNVKI